MGGQTGGTGDAAAFERSPLGLYEGLGKELAVLGKVRDCLAKVDLASAIQIAKFGDVDFGRGYAVLVKVKTDDVVKELRASEAISTTRVLAHLEALRKYTQGEV